MRARAGGSGRSESTRRGSPGPCPKMGSRLIVIPHGLATRLRLTKMRLDRHIAGRVATRSEVSHAPALQLGDNGTESLSAVKAWARPLHSSVDPQCHGLGAAVQAPFPVETLEMGTNGSYTHVEFDSDPFVGPAAADQVNDLVLARCEWRHLRWRPHGRARLHCGGWPLRRHSGPDCKQFDEMHSPGSSVAANSARKTNGGCD